MKVPLCVPYVGEEEKKAIDEVIDSHWYTHGPKNKEFEERFAEYIGVKHAISMNSCASALQLAIQCQDLKGEVILPSFTFPASANAIVNAGCKPVFVDINNKTWNMDHERLEEKVNKNTAAIMPVHIAGQCCNMDPIMKIAEKYGLKVIEDSAETIGGTYKCRRAGSFGIGCFSFFPTKNMTTGEGGMLTTNDSKLADRVRAYVGHGITSTTLDREAGIAVKEAVVAGYNFRMSNILAALGLVQLSKIDEMNLLRREKSAYLESKLKDLDKIYLPYESKDCEHVYQMFIIKLGDLDRDKFVGGLKEKGIGASVHFYPPVHQQKFYKENFSSVELPITERVSKSIVTLPMYPGITKEQLDYVAGCVKDGTKS